MAIKTRAKTILWGRSLFVNGNQAEPLIPVALAIPVIAILTFICCAVTSKLISYIPGSKYIIGA